MFKPKLVILILLFIMAALLTPLAMSSCGMNGFHISLGAPVNTCGSAQNLSHLSFMRGLLVMGLSVAFFVFAILLPEVYKVLFLSFFDKFSRNLRLNFLFLRKKFLAGLLHPFDRLSLAYSRGLIQPKIFFLP